MIDPREQSWPPRDLRMSPGPSWPAFNRVQDPIEGGARPPAPFRNHRGTSLGELFATPLAVARRGRGPTLRVVEVDPLPPDDEGPPAHLGVDGREVFAEDAEEDG